MEVRNGGEIWNRTARVFLKEENLNGASKRRSYGSLKKKRKRELIICFEIKIRNWEKINRTGRIKKGRLWEKKVSSWSGLEY